MNMPSHFYNAGPFMPHGSCYFWTTSLIALHAGSDALITLSYYSIPLTLIYFVIKRTDLKFHWMFVCFALFILACGTTHLMEIWNIWHGDYWLSGCIKATTAAASVPTAILLAKLIPQALALPSPSALQKAYDQLEVRVQERTAQITQTSINLEAEVSERIRVEQKLRASLKEIGDLKAALDEHAIVAITDPQGKITRANDKFCAISKYSREELIGQDHRLINSGHHSKGFIRELWSTIGQGRVWKGEIKNRAKDGSYYWVDTTIVPFLDAGGKPYQYVAIRADITERKLAEQKIRESNEQLEHRVAQRTAQLEAANQELEAFSYSVSHDLRAPLRAVNGFANIVLEEYGSQLPEEGRLQLNRIRNAGHRMGNLIDDLLEFSLLNRQQLNRRTVSHSQLIQEILAESAPLLDGRAVETRIGELPECQGDPSLLKQVWANLLSNAFKYTRGRSPAIVEIGCEPENGKEVYFVRDNGTGFDMKYADKLFGVFQRLHRSDEFEGTGVGLAIVQRILHRHGGRIWVAAKPEQGATFRFTIQSEADT